MKMISIITDILLIFSISADYNIHLNNLQTTKNKLTFSEISPSSEVIRKRLLQQNNIFHRFLSTNSYYCRLICNIQLVT